MKAEQREALKNNPLAREILQAMYSYYEDNDWPLAPLETAQPEMPRTIVGNLLIRKDDLFKKVDSLEENNAADQRRLREALGLLRTLGFISGRVDTGYSLTQSGIDFIEDQQVRKTRSSQKNTSPLR